MTNPSSAQTFVEVLLVFLAVWGLSVLVARRKRASRFTAMSAMCAAAGLKPGPMDVTDQFTLPTSGDRHGFENQFTSLADFWSSGRGYIHRYTVTTLDLPGLQMPYVMVSRKNTPQARDPFDALLGLQRVELESTEFTDRFVVRAKDPRSAIMLLDPQMMQFLLDCGEVSFELVGDYMLASVYRPNDSSNSTWGTLFGMLNPVDTSQVRRLLQFRGGIGSRIPALLQTDFALPAN